MTDSSLEESLYRQFLTVYVLLDDGDRRTFKKIALTITQYNFLRALDNAAADSLTVTEAANILLCTRGNITRLVQRLSKSGLVRVGSDANDQRLVRIFLTAAGKEKVAEAHQLHQASIQRRLAALTPAQRQQLIDLTATAVQLLKADLAAQSN
ncbi:MarR family winged helix-turn-helix transcriptional regulator [Candidatus Leptofilum sp.]|uniref:MarR family winged helix-turn-helix transcriptional regulator n=1 Tax=Candidatus Leptofilum sp. TaxID=3241576 RepID=UPI003B5C22AB